MALFENFPYTNMQELNLDWIIKQFKILEQSTVLSVNGQTGQVVLYQAKNVQFPDVPEENWSIIRMCDGTMRGIYFANDNTAYILHGNDLEALYSANNQPPYPVTSVNGSTGDVILYPGEEVILPSIDDNTKHSWAIFRDLNNVTRGIKFKDDGSAVLMVGNQEYPVYSSNNQPPYPVSSVNGKTGTVSLFTDNDGNVTFPPVSDPNTSSWMIQRSINGDTVGIEFNDDGTINVIINEVPYKIYTEYDPADGFVTDPSQAIMQTTENITGYIWGLIRDTDNGAVGFIFNNTDNTDPDMYIRYKDNNDQMQNLRLLTEGDIPSTGVYNVNGKSGVVTLYASDINMDSNDNRTIPDALEDVEEIIAVVENTDTAIHNISEGDYVIWKHELYTASTAIVIGDTLSLSNLTLENTTVFKEIKKINDKLALSTITDTTFLSSVFDTIEPGWTITRIHVVKTEFIIDLYMQFSYNQAITVTASGNISNIKLATFNLNYEPASYYGCKLTSCDDSYKTEVINYGNNIYVAAFRNSENGYTIPANTSFAVQGTYITDH